MTEKCKKAISYHISCNIILNRVNKHIIQIFMIRYANITKCTRKIENYLNQELIGFKFVRKIRTRKTVNKNVYGIEIFCSQPILNIY